MLSRYVLVFFFAFPETSRFFLSSWSTRPGCVEKDVAGKTEMAVSTADLLTRQLGGGPGWQWDEWTHEDEEQHGALGICLQGGMEVVAVNACASSSPTGRRYGFAFDST